jgi:hypothetical protein
MEQARKLLDAGTSACKTPVEKQRVRLADDSLQLFEQFMKLRHDQAEGRFLSLAADAGRWRLRAEALADQYKEQYAFTRPPWAKETANGSYFAQFYQKTYDDASRIAKDFRMLTTPPLRVFRYQADPDLKGEAQGWAKPAFEDGAWKSTDVCVETWSTLGYHDYFKSMWYRTALQVPAVAPGKKVYLWLGSTDGRAKVFVNGQAVPYVDAGKAAEEASGYCQPFSFDITAAVRPGEKNTLAILCTRTDFNELGTGGLLAPVALYAERP